MSNTKADKLFTPQRTNQKLLDVIKPTSSQEQLSGIKQRASKSINKDHDDVNQNENKHQRARSLKQTDHISYNRLVESQIKEMIDQQYPNYQHQEASCVCPTCLCGRCMCKVKAPQKLYPKDLRSIYQQEYPWKEGGAMAGKNPSQYESFKGDPYSLNKDSMYRQDYLPFKVQNNENPHQKKAYFRDSSPFEAVTQYTRDYLPAGAVRSIAMKPFDQIANPAQSDLPHLLDTTYRNDFKKFQPTGNQEFENNKYKMHIHPDQPNLYLNTTYQNAYIKKQGQRPGKYLSGISNMPFGQGNGQSYKTNYRDHYVQMELRKCPARVVLEEICDHTQTHGMDYTMTAVSQIIKK